MLALGGCRATSGPERPNIVLMLADDLGYGDIGCTGHPYARTPAIDRLADEGSLFLGFYQAGATCVPTRTALMTGRFPATFRKHPRTFGFGGAITITELLQQRGYRTGHFGKWHIGPEGKPGVYGIESVQVMAGHPGHPKGRDASAVSAAIDFIRANRERPFYVNIWFHAVHHEIRPHSSFTVPFAGVSVDRAEFPNPDMQRHFAVYESLGGDLDRGMRTYLGEVLQLDSQVGRVVGAIDELGLRENTLVAFTSDNGPAKCSGRAGPRGTELRENVLGSAGPFRDRKHSLYDGGIHLPLIICWPGRVPEGRVDSTSLIAGVDWLPSLCAVTGIEIASDAFDGEDVSDIWMGGPRGRKKDLYWKGFEAAARPVMRRDAWKLHLRRERGVELYNLETDPGERENVANAYPEVAQALRVALERWDSSLAAVKRTAPEREGWNGAGT